MYPSAVSDWELGCGLGRGDGLAACRGFKILSYHEDLLGQAQHGSHLRAQNLQENVEIALHVSPKERGFDIPRTSRSLISISIYVSWQPQPLPWPWVSDPYANLR